jgi:hypothetical protein
MDKIYRASGNKELNHFLLHQFNILARKLDPNIDKDTANKLIADMVYAVGKKYDLTSYVNLIPDHSIDPKYKIEYAKFFSINSKNLENATAELSFEVLGQYMTLIAQIGYDTNKLFITGSKQTMTKGDMKELLQVTYDKCNVILNKLISQNLLVIGENDSKYTLYCPNSLAHQKNPLDKTPTTKRKKVDYPKTIKVSKEVFINAIFTKTTKENRRSTGKVTLGVFFRLVFMMNESQEVRIRNKSGLVPFLERKFNLPDFKKHFDILIKHNFIQQSKGVIYINPVYAKLYRTSFTQEVKNIFGIETNIDVPM